MSELLAAAAQQLDAPEEIVMRSAQARASADGLSVDEVLEAWAGGAAVAVALAEAPTEAPAQPVAEAPAAVETEPTEAPAPAAAETAPAEAPAPAAPAAEPAVLAPVAAPPPIVVEVIEEPQEPVEIPPLSERVKAPLALGALVGLVLAFVGLLAASSWLIGAAAATPTDDPAPALLVSATTVIAAVGAISIVFGGLSGVLGRSLPTYAHPGARLSTRPWSAFIIGAVVGTVLGAAVAAVLLGVFGETIEITTEGGSEARTLIRLLPSLTLILLGGALLGSLAAVTPHLAGMPAALVGEEAKEPTMIRRRLAVGYAAPLITIGTIAILVYSFSRVLLQWPQYAPAVASIIALSVLGFAALVRIRPGTRLRRGDVYAALSGVALIVIVIVALLATFSGDGEHETGEGGNAESRAVVQLV